MRLCTSLSAAGAEPGSAEVFIPIKPSHPVPIRPYKSFRGVPTGTPNLPQRLRPCPAHLSKAHAFLLRPGSSEPRPAVRLKLARALLPPATHELSPVLPRRVSLPSPD